MRKKKSILGKIWYFIWEDNSLASWLVNIVLAFVLVKFVIYPGLGLAFGTGFPVVAVVSGSMEHNGQSFEPWWEQNKNWYIENGITKEQFQEFPFYNGFNKGDIMVLFGTKPENLKIGQVIVYKSKRQDHPPIIHRITSRGQEDTEMFFITKGDHNTGPDPDIVKQEKLLGKAVLRIPYLGWVKIACLSLLKIIIGR